MSPPNLSAIARHHNISRNTLQRWRDQGLELADEKAVAERVLTMRRPEATHTPPPPQAGSETYAEARRRRAIADANLAELKAGQQAGKLVDLATVEEAFAVIGYTLRARLLALPSAIVPELEGLTAAQIQICLKKHVHQLLTDLHENNPSEKLTAASPNTQDPATAKDASRG